MPEICEVEVVKQQLGFMLEGRVLEGVKVVKPLNKGAKSAEEFEPLLGRKLTAKRWAKYLYFAPETGPHLIQSHLGMSGSWLSYSKNELSRDTYFQTLAMVSKSLSERHVRYELELDGGLVLVYFDFRGFGEFKCVTLQDESPQSYMFPTPDILDPTFQLSNPVLEKHWSKKTTIYKHLHDQALFPGMGAYLGAEWLFRCGLHPETPMKDVDKTRFPIYETELQELLCEMLDANGSTLANYYDAEGSAGHGQDYFYVYGRDGLPCKVCQTTVSRLKGRGSHFCPKCQPI